MVYSDSNDITGNTLNDGTFGISVKGHGGDVVDMFCEMQRMGAPSADHIFMSVLSTCSHCGLVDEARDIFDHMGKVFGVLHNVHHYGCMANILGRAGQLNRVYQFILSRNIYQEYNLGAWDLMRSVRLSLVADEVSHPEVLVVIKKYKSWMDGIWDFGITEYADNPHIKEVISLALELQYELSHFQE
ncbi:hypothetical protein ACLB2K_057447 [Fragaria x ananassa]